jgi:UDP-glucose 4,6-dehydratase
MKQHLRLAREFQYWMDDAEFYRQAARTPRSNCVLDVSKIVATGIPLRPVEEALEDTLRHWTPELNQPQGASASYGS